MARNTLKSTMSEPTKRLRTTKSRVKKTSLVRKNTRKITLTASLDGNHIRYEVPKKLLKDIEQYKIESKDEISISSDNLISKLSKGLPEYAVNMKGIRSREGLTQNEFAKSLKIQQANVSAMENGRRPIGKELAKKISKKFKVDYRIFL